MKGHINKSTAVTIRDSESTHRTAKLNMNVGNELIRVIGLERGEVEGAEEEYGGGREGGR